MDQRALRTELRAAMRLDHPNIVRVYDFGSVDAPSEDGGLYLVMEEVTGGTLATRCGTMHWVEIRDVAVGLLKGLAHAHARSIVHRDLKPANVLLDASGRVPKLADFGLATWVSSSVEPAHWGTPNYMAPEQIRGEWRDYGPWTDLYALGCTLYALVTGSPPYDGPPLQSRMGHLTGRLPPLRARTPVPAGFESWLRRLLEKVPARRWRRAADALDALERLGSPAWATPNEFRPNAGPDDPTLNLSVSEPVAQLDDADGRLVARVPARVQFPTDWRAVETRMPRRPALGLRLVGLRSVSLVGLEPERDELWHALAEVVQSGASRVVQLQGGGGSGKTALLEWLAHTAHEVGIGVLEARHFPEPGEGQGLSAMLAEHLHVQGLEREALIARLQTLVGGQQGTLGDADALVELLQPFAVGQEGLRLSSSAERFEVLARLLSWFSSERPMVVVLDDVQWGDEALAFLEYWLSRGRSGAVLFVVAADAEALGRQLDEALRWRRIEDAGSRSLSLGRLSPVEQRELIEQLVVIEPTLARRIQERSEGDPRVARQLLLYLTDQNVLEPGEYGFGLQAPLELPASFAEVVEGRLKHALDHLPSAVLAGLELAAANGMLVAVSDWQEACDRAGLQLSYSTVDALLDLRLAAPGLQGAEQGWRFAHPVVREVFLARARRGGRLGQHHAVWAELLAERTDGRDYVAMEHIAAHHRKAGEDAAALSTLRREVMLAALYSSDFAALHRLTQQALEVMDRLALPPDDPRRGMARFLAYLRLRRVSPMEACLPVLERLEADAQAHDWWEIQVECLLARSMVQRSAGRMDPALEIAEQALELAIAHSLGWARANALFRVGDILVKRGDLRRGLRYLERAIRAAKTDKHVLAEANAELVIGQAHAHRGQDSRGLAHLERSLQLYQRLGARWSVASTLNAVAEVHRNLGRYNQARQLYWQSQQLLEVLGSKGYHFPWVNRLMVDIEQGREADMDELDRCIAFFASNGFESARLAAVLTRIGARAVQGEVDLEQVNQALDDAAAMQHGSRVLAHHLEFAALGLSKHGHAPQVDRLLEACRLQYQRMEMVTEEARIAALRAERTR